MPRDEPVTIAVRLTIFLDFGEFVGPSTSDRSECIVWSWDQLAVSVQQDELGFAGIFLEAFILRLRMPTSGAVAPLVRPRLRPSPDTRGSSSALYPQVDTLDPLVVLESWQVWSRIRSRLTRLTEHHSEEH
jgi:hypothetical protein